ncbi:MAG TPA: biotin-dependent carboxyltransferase family protein [Candidatus Cryosericum sp.]|nr:biotin-dependent carboxyltransferase family protein [Candidatus Cryosericum sp.]
MGSMSVVSGGLFTTVQDLGRPGHGRIGVSAAGAADALSFRIANRLAGNPDNAPALEMTILGGTFQFESPAYVALAGADMHPVIEPGEAQTGGARGGTPAHGDAAPANGGAAPAHEVRMLAAFKVAAGQRLRLGAALSGARTYLAVHGGFDVALLLGSASTHAPSRLGGFEGRPLRQGDRLRFGDAPAPRTLRRLVATDRGPLAARVSLRVTDGPQAERFAAASREAFFASPYTVTSESDRMGLRLAGAPLPAPSAGRMATEGMPLGAIQIPPEGQPVILFVDHQTTGGYPVVASVISADLHQVGQLRPRDVIRFESVPLLSARDLLLEQEAWLDATLPAAS